MIEPKQHNSTKTIITGVILLNVLLALLMITSHSMLATNKPSTNAIINTLLVSRTLFWLLTILMYIYVIKAEKQSFIIYKPAKNNIGFYALSVLLLIIAVFIVAVFAGILLKLTGLYTGVSRIYALVLKAFSKSPYLLIFTVVTAGVTEELLFRAYLFTRLQLLFKNNYMPVIISSVIFGLVHIGYGTIQNVVVPVFIGAVFALYYMRYKNIIAIIIAHGLYDYLVILLALHVQLLSGK